MESKKDMPNLFRIEPYCSTLDPGPDMIVVAQMLVAYLARVH